MPRFNNPKFIQFPFMPDASNASAARAASPSSRYRIACGISPHHIEFIRVLLII